MGKKIHLEETDYKTANQRLIMYPKRNNEFLLLSRKNRGKLELRKYIEELNIALGLKIMENKFLKLEDTDVIISEFRNSYSAQPMNNHFICNINDNIKVKEKSTKIRELFGSSKGYLITSKSEYCGVNLVEVAICIDNFKKIISIDGDSLAIYLPRQKSGLLIDLFEDYIDGRAEWLYDFCYW